MLKKLNNYFLCDPDEQASVTDYIFFYGLSAMLVLISIFVLIALGKGAS